MPQNGVQCESVYAVLLLSRAVIHVDFFPENRYAALREAVKEGSMFAFVGLNRVE